MHTRKKSLSRTEWSLMNICWRKGKISARDVYDETLKEKQRGYQTVKTMLDRMVEKGFLSREKFGPIWLYEPMVTRASVMKREIESFIGTVLDNSVAPLFAHLADSESLSDEDHAALKKLVDKQEGDE